MPPLHFCSNSLKLKSGIFPYGMLFVPFKYCAGTIVAMRNSHAMLGSFDREFNLDRIRSHRLHSPFDRIG
jgi:hypothetical protein